MQTKKARAEAGDWKEDENIELTLTVVSNIVEEVEKQFSCLVSVIVKVIL